jgi:DNA polymerase-1
MGVDIAFDTETTGLRWDKGDVPFLLQYADENVPAGVHALLGPARERGPVTSPGPQAVRRSDAINRLWTPGARLVGANVGFDVHQMRAEGVDLLARKANVVDLQTLAKVVAPERRWGVEDDDRPDHRGYGLKELGTTYFDPDAKDAEEELERLAEKHGFKLKAKEGQKGYMPRAYYELWLREPEAMEFYAREDVRLTLGTVAALEAQLTDKTSVIWDIEQQVGPIIWQAEATGIRVDGDKAALLRDEYALKAERLHAELDRELPDGWDENNDKMAEALLEVGVPLSERTKDGHYAVNKYALERQIDNHPIIKTLFEYREAEKFVSTYLDHFVGEDVIHPTFNAIGTWTGRMSGVSPNMQNIPVRAGTAVRELFIPREGMAFVGIDFEQIELRLLGYYLHDEGLTERIENDDFFAWVASQVSEFVAEFGPDPAAYHKGALGEHLRVKAKNGTYAIVYGVGGVKLGKMFGWPPDSVYTERDWVVRNGYKQAGEPRNLRAETFIKQVKSILNGYYHLTRDRIEPKVQQTGAVDTILGRHQWLGHDGAWKGLSGLVQGGAADIYKKALIEATAAVADLGATPLLFIHDEIVFETPAENAQRTLEVASAAMENAMPGFRPRLAVEGHIAYNNWGEAK